MNAAHVPAVLVADVVKRYGGRAVVDGLTFDVQPGEVFCLLGPNGAGKTTTVEMLEGLRTPDAGSVRVLGLDPRREGRGLRHRIGVMPQGGRLYARIRADEAVRHFAAFYDDPLDPDDVLTLVGLEEAVRRTPWRRLSGGEQQRLSLALALVGRPHVAFLDEPTAGMDAHARAATWDVVRGLASRGCTVLLTTHLLDEAERLSDRVAIIHLGRLVALGPPAALAAAGAGGTGIRFRATPGLDVTALGAAVGGTVVEERPGEYRAAGTEGTGAAVAKLTSWLAERGVSLADLTVGSRSLEDVFLSLTREPGRQEAERP